MELPSPIEFEKKGGKKAKRREKRQRGKGRKRGNLAKLLLILNFFGIK